MTIVIGTHAAALDAPHSRPIRLAPTINVDRRSCDELEESRPEVMLGLCLLSTLITGALGFIVLVSL